MKGIHVQLLCVGKMKEKFYIDAAAEYVKRLGAYCRLQMVELPEERLPANPSRAQIDAALEKEGAAIRSAAGTGSLAFVIGGSYGLHPDIKALARLRLSMSPMTFPHHLARVMLLEQLYRAFKIDEGSSYHK